MSILLDKRFWIAMTCVYAVVWVGGEASFRYTHHCLRYNIGPVDDGSGDVGVGQSSCAFYSANGRRWTVLDPVRVLIGWNF